MKKMKSKLRLNEISIKDLFFFLLKNSWAVLLIMVASAITAWTVLDSGVPDEYTASATLAVNMTNNYESWDAQYKSSIWAADKVTDALTAHGSELGGNSLYENDLSADLTVQPIIGTNFIELTAAANTPEEAYLYLCGLMQQQDKILDYVDINHVMLETVSTPVMPQANESRNLIVIAAITVAAGIVSCMAIVLIRIMSGVIVTRKAADRLINLPIAGKWCKGGKGKGAEACLPLPTSENAKGEYIRAVNESVSFLRSQFGQEGCKCLLLRPLNADGSAKQKKRTLTDSRRIGFHFAYQLAEAGDTVYFADDQASDWELVSEHFSNGGALTVCRSANPKWSEEKTDWIICANGALPPKLPPNIAVRTLWTLAAGSLTATEVNRITGSGMGDSLPTLGILLYGLGSEEAIESELSEEDDELDLIRLFSAFFGHAKRIRKQIVAALAAVTAAALALATALTFGDADAELVTKFKVSADALPEETDYFETHAPTDDADFVGNDLTPNPAASDASQLSAVLPAIWSSQAMKDTLRDALGWIDLPETVSVTHDNAVYLLTVSGGDREALQAISDAFFSVHGSLTDHVAGRLTLTETEQTLHTHLISNVLIGLVGGWFATLLVFAGYLLFISYKDDSLYMADEIEECTKHSVVGKLNLTQIPTKNNAPTDCFDCADAGIVRLVHDWTVSREAQSGCHTVLVTSALAEEGCSELILLLAAMLRQRGKRVSVLNAGTESPDGLNAETISQVVHSAQKDSDFLLISYPGAAFDRTIKLYAAQADEVIWAIRKGYADRTRVADAFERLALSDQKISCVLTDASV